MISIFYRFSRRSEIGCLPYFHTWCGLSANLECMSEMCCTRLAENTQKSSFWLMHVSTIGKNLLNNHISSTCPHNMVNFGLITAEICWTVWGTPANFNGFRVLAALLHGTLVVGGRQPNFAALDRGRHLYSAGRSSHWALAHILVFFSWPNLSGRRLDVYHTSTHNVALVRI